MFAIRRLGAFAAATTLAATSLVGLAAAPAQAALATCNVMTYKVNASGSETRILPGYQYGWELSYDCLLREGNRGEAVVALQRSLRYCYGYSLALDGVFGPKTRSALVNAQRRAGTAADGVYGPNTRRAFVWPPDDFKVGGVPCIKVG